MKRELKSYRVTILGDEYTIMSDESEEHLVESANYVHVLLQDALRKSPHGLPKKVAVLTSLQLASELRNAQAVTRQQEEKSAELVQSVDRLIGSIVAGG
jgi:cell division protein ZapA (FtsZ GTPase activity inhibitor)